MIPKILHYCWFGPKEKPESFRMWLQSWKKYLPDYEMREWNETNFDVSHYLYCREAYNTGNWAFVSDVCRVEALYKYGGIYLDTDVEICCNLDNYLTSLNGFVGWESTSLIGTGLLASEKESKWTAGFLDYYAKTHFINIFGHPNRLPNTSILTHIILPNLPMCDRPLILPLGFICGIDFETKEAQKIPDTIAVHHYDASWKGKKSLKTKVRNIRNGLLARYFNINTNKN